MTEPFDREAWAKRVAAALGVADAGLLENELRIELQCDEVVITARVSKAVKLTDAADLLAALAELDMAEQERR